jgi:hypothetical protein
MHFWKRQQVASHHCAYASLFALQGCSGQQDKDTAPLLQMARLLSAMEAQRATSSKSTLQMPSTHQPALDQGLQQQQPDASSKVTQLLNTAAGQLSKVLSENVQLFPSDMGDMLKAYRCRHTHGTC